MFDSTVYCVTTASAVAEGVHPAGAKVAILGAYVVDVVGSEVYIAYPVECPPGYACGDMMGILLIDSSQVTPPPPESFPDVYGTTTGEVTSGAASIIANAWVY